MCGYMFLFICNNSICIIIITNNIFVFLFLLSVGGDQPDSYSPQRHAATAAAVWLQLSVVLTTNPNSCRRLLSALCGSRSVRSAGGRRLLLSHHLSHLSLQHHVHPPLTLRVCVCGCVCVECMKQLLASSPATAKKQKKSSQSQHDGGNVFGFNEYESQIRPCWATSGGFDVGRRLTPASGMTGWRSRHENRQSLRQVDAGLRHAALC